MENVSGQGSHKTPTAGHQLSALLSLCWPAGWSVWVDWGSLWALESGGQGYNETLPLPGPSRVLISPGLCPHL